MKIILFIVSSLYLISAYGQTDDAYYKKAQEFYHNNDVKSALTQINLALKGNPQNPDYLLLKGNFLEQLGEYQMSYDTYSLIIRLFPNNAVALNQRGLLLNKVQDFQSAIEDFNQALSLNNIDSLKLTLYLNRGAAKINLRNFQGAYDDFMRGYEIDSLDIGTLNNLATVCDEVGKGNKTLEYLNKIIQIDSTFVGAYGNIGFKYQEMGDYNTAIQYFNKVLSLQPDEPLGFSNRAFNRFKLGDLNGALADINKSLSIYQNNSYAYRIRALIYFSKGEKIKACKDLDEAIRLGFTTMYGNEVEDLKIKHCNYSH